jgi:hypothetical protein
LRVLWWFLTGKRIVSDPDSNIISAYNCDHNSYINYWYYHRKESGNSKGIEN